MAVIPTGDRPENPAAALVTALACDVAVVDVPAEVGMDATTGTIWRWLEASGLSRVVAVTGLSSASPDFDDLTAIAQRVLAEDCLPVHLPVLDDNEEPVASLDLTRSHLNTATERRPAEAGHLAAAQGDLSALLSVLAASVSDDGAAVQYERELNSLGEVVGPLLSTASDTNRARDLAELVAEGVVAPVVAHTPDEAWINDLPAWRSTAPPSDRLVRRDEHDKPAQGWAAVVLSTEGDRTLARGVFESPKPGPAMITAVGADAQGRPVPLRAWPTSLEAAVDVATGLNVSADLALWSSAVTTHLGDTLAEAHIWLLPAHNPDE